MLCLHRGFLWHMNMLPPLSICIPCFRKVDLSTHGPMQWHFYGWLVSNILSSNNSLAIGYFSYKATILSSNAYGATSLFEESCIIKSEHATNRTQGNQVLHTQLIKGVCIPIGISQEMLQAFGGGTSERCCYGITVLAW